MSRRPTKPWEARLQDAHRFVAGGPAVGRVLSATPVERQIMVAYGASTGSAPPEGTGGGEEPTTVDFTFYPDGNPDFLDAFSFSGWGGSSTSVERPAGVGTGPFLDDSGGDTSYPGLVWHDGLLWMSYYSSHEGKTSIYLARIRLPQ